MCSPTPVTDDGGPGTFKARHNHHRTDSCLLRERGLAVRYGTRTRLVYTSSETCRMEAGVVRRDVPEVLRPGTLTAVESWCIQAAGNKRPRQTDAEETGTYSRTSGRRCEQRRREYRRS